MSKEERRKKVLDLLNKAKSMELQAIHQYMHQHYHLDDQDFGELAAQVKLIAIDEMRHAEAFAERIKELGGEPTSDLAGPVVKGQDVKEIFPFDANEEDDAIDTYGQYAKLCRDYGDTITANLFEMIVQHEQDHFNYFDDVDTHIEKLGETYLSNLAGTSGDTGPSKGFSYSDGEE